VIKIPYTPLLTIAGLILGIIPDFQQLPVMEQVVTKLNPQFMLIFFLPALIFESAFSSDWHTFRMQLSKILILAFPMLMAATILTALVMYYILNYQGVMTFTECVLFGAIISATDPVAVVALLKELGASKKLATLIEGESLLNDGTAMVIFMIATKMAEGEEMSVGKGLVLFARLSLGGPILGLAFALILTFWLGRIHNSPVLECNLTICFAYVTYYVAEMPGVHVSGILAIVCLGLYMTKKGKLSISSESEIAVHHVWQTIGFCAETLIFFLSGVMIGYHN